MTYLDKAQNGDMSDESHETWLVDIPKPLVQNTNRRDFVE
jgi:hypothetical protein